MHKIAIYLIALVMLVKTNGQEMNGLDNKRTPGIIGAYSSPMSPLGPTDAGYVFSVGFTQKDQTESSSLIFWINRQTGVLTEVKSIATINMVIKDAAGRPLDGMEIAQRLIATQISSAGRTGFPLRFDSDSELAHVILNLKKAGLDERVANRLLQLGREAGKTINSSANEWSAMWYEIDRDGEVERVTVRGKMEPLRVTATLREAITDIGDIDSKLLYRRNLFSTDQSKPSIR